MKNILNLTFYKSLINSDFSLLSVNSSKNINYINSDVKINAFNRLKTLEIFQLLKNSKQFIRILQFIKFNKLAEVNIILANKQYFYLLKKYLLEYPVSGTLNIHYLSNKSKKKANIIAFDIFFGNTKSEDHIAQMKSTVTNNTFLIQHINSKMQLSQNGTYKIYNDTYDFKKIIFLIGLLNLVFKNKL